MMHFPCEKHAKLNLRNKVLFDFWFEKCSNFCDSSFYQNSLRRELLHVLKWFNNWCHYANQRMGPTCRHTRVHKFHNKKEGVTIWHWFIYAVCINVGQRHWKKFLHRSFRSSIFVSFSCYLLNFVVICFCFRYLNEHSSRW